MKRTVRAARTMHDLDHVNRIRFPAFRIVNLFLKAGAKSSKSYLPPEAPAGSGGDSGNDNFHFIPEKETIEIHYEIDDKYGIADGGKLELYNRWEETPLWSLDLKMLGPDWVKQGTHVVKWDGRVVTPTAKQDGTPADGGMKHDLTTIDADKTAHADFPDGYITLEHPPYKLRLKLNSEAEPELKDRPVIAWTYFQILVKSLEFVLGPKEAVPAAVVDDDRHKMDKKVRDRIETDGGLPAKDQTRKVYLISNLFKTSSAEMNSNVAFTLYETMWGDGPNIPILVKIRLADSADVEVKLEESDKGAVALGKTRFLWDWEDPDENVDAGQGQPKPKSFIKNAINFDKATTEPKGDNCHKERGGKRGPGSKPVFPDQAGYDAKDALDEGKFPFKVSNGDGSGDPKPKLRKWAAYSQAWTKGKLKGQTGVVFQPSRMAGDDYKLTVYVAFDRKAKDTITLDENTQPLVAADAIKQVSCKFQVWREIHLVRYVRKNSTIAAFLPGNIGAIQALYREPYIEVENKMDADNSYTLDDHRLNGGATPDYNQICKNILTGSGNVIYTEELAVEGTADHASVDSAFKTRSYIEFVRKVHTTVNPRNASNADFTAIPGASEEQLGAASLPDFPSTAAPNRPALGRLGRTQNKLASLSMTTKKEYCGSLDEEIFPFIKGQLIPALQVISGSKNGVNKPAAEGVTVAHFNYSHTALRDLIASDPGTGSKLGSAINPGDSTRNKCAFLYVSPRVDTFVHEIGHHLFLPHFGPKPNSFRADRHDSSDLKCMMTYNRPRLAFCGLCQLRLRGWSASALVPASASNKRP
jgi:hypothetical protein